MDSTKQAPRPALHGLRSGMARAARGLAGCALVLGALAIFGLLPGSGVSGVHHLWDTGGFMPNGAGAVIAALPEATLAPFDAPLRELAQPLDGPFATGIREAARARGVTVVVGTLTPAESGERVRNTLLVTGPGVEERYDKIHLYDAYGSRESELVEPGDRIVTVDVPTPSGPLRIGLATCYDVRFADQFTALGRAGAQLVVLPASWGEAPGKAEQWDLLVRARAHDAQAWLLACDQAWTPPRGKAALGIGRSALLDPSGGVRARLDHAPGLLVGDIDLEAVTATRRRVPLL